MQTFLLVEGSYISQRGLRHPYALETGTTTYWGWSHISCFGLLEERGYKRNKWINVLATAILQIPRQSKLCRFTSFSKWQVWVSTATWNTWESDRWNFLFYFFELLPTFRMKRLGNRDENKTHAFFQRSTKKTNAIITKKMYSAHIY